MENYNTRHYLMFPSSMNSSFKSSSPSSWELDIWPPRSYTCSFCNRVFRSAQALGGHMNIHKRERARLKQHSSDLKSSDSKLDDSSRSFSHQNKQLIKNYKEYDRYNYPIVRGMKMNGHDLINESVKRSREITALHQHHLHHDNNGLHDEFIMSTKKFINLVDNATIMSKRHKSERLMRSIDQSISTCSHKDDIDLELRLGQVILPH